MTLLPSHLTQSNLGEKCAVYLDSVAGSIHNLNIGTDSLQNFRHRTVGFVKASPALRDIAKRFDLDIDGNDETTILAITVIVAFVIAVAVGVMSWRSPFNLWRRNPPQVSDNQYSYITGEDVYDRPQQQGQTQNNQETDAEPDILLLKHRKTTYPLHFPAYAIDDGVLTVSHLRQRAAEATQAQNPNRIKLLYKGKLLDDDELPCKSEGLKQQSEVLCVVSEVPGERTPSEHSEAEVPGPVQSETKPRKKKGKKSNKKKKSPREAPEQPQPQSQAQPAGRSAYSLPAPAPNLKAFPTPLEQAHALHAYFRSELLPLCNEYVANTPTDPKLRDFEHKKLSETTLAQVILKADGIVPDGDPEARNARKELVKEAQSALNRIDEALKI